METAVLARRLTDWIKDRVLEAGCRGVVLGMRAASAHKCATPLMPGF